MNITGIKIQNILKIEQIDLSMGDQKIHLIAGRNRSGKSSMRDAIAAALKKDVEVLRGVDKVKDYGMLVHDGAKAGGAVVTIDDDADKSFEFNLPKGHFAGPEITDAMKVSVDGQRFAAMSNDQRRAFLFALTGLKMTGATIKPRMKAAGCDEAMTDVVLPQLRTGGFAAAEKFATDEALVSKRAWCAATGKSAYAPKIAEGWSAPVPDLPPHDLAALVQAIADNEAATATITESLGAIRQAVQTAQENALRRTSLAASVTRVPELEKLLPAATKERDEYEKTVEALRGRAKGTARVGLVHDLARHIWTETPSDAPRAVAQAKLMNAYANEHGTPNDLGQSDPEAVATLPLHENGLTVLNRKVENMKRDLDTARMAKGQYDALQADEEAPQADGEIAEVQGLLDAAKAEHKKLMNQKLDVEAATRQRAEAEKKTMDAAAAHLQVAAWQKIAERMAPGGILADMLGDAIAIVNDKLDQAALDTDWPRVVLGADTSLMIDGRPYLLESESGKWRADCMIAQVVSEISGLKMMLLDGMDVLDLRDRAVLLNWLDILVSEGLLDTALVFATLRKPPVSADYGSHWIEGGALVAFEESKEFAGLSQSEQDAYLDAIDAMAATA